MTFEEFKDEAEKMIRGPIMDNQLEKFRVFQTALIAWNEKINLTAITDPSEILSKHFLDSLSSLAGLPANFSSLIDVGSGGGFPGLPIAIIRPDIQVTLLDARAKKTDFLAGMIETLGLTNVQCVAMRAEDAGHDSHYREQFDCAIARAVAPLPTLMEYLLPFVRVHGRAIAQKSKDAENISDAEAAITQLGGRYERTIPVNTPSLPDRELIIVEKVSKTPESLPRRPGVPEKKPLE